MIKSLAELETAIENGEDFEVRNQEYWEDYNLAFGMLSDIRKMISHRRLRVKKVDMINAIIIYRASNGDLADVLKFCNTSASILNNFKTCNFQNLPIWSKLIDGDTGDLLEVFYRDKEDTK